jgi:hypothetical protein
MDLIKKLDKSGLRQFGITTGILFGVFLGVIVPIIWSVPFPIWPWYVSGTLCLVGLIFPFSLNPIYYAWMTIGNVLGFINTRILMGIIFYVFFCPLGCTLRIFGNDLLSLKLDPAKKSYRSHSKIRDIKHFNNPY